MNPGDTQVRLYLAVLLSTILLGSVGLAIFEGLSFFDAIYFVIVTVATVGYGDIVPVTVAGRVLVLVLILAGVGAFVTVAAYLFEMVLSQNDLRARQRKVKMILGVFFSEVGVPLITYCKEGVPDFQSGIQDLIVTNAWERKRFSQAKKNLARREYRVDICSVDLRALQHFLSGKRAFLVQILQHPMLFEHEPLSEMITAICHFEEELSARRDLTRLQPPDCAHLSRDCERVLRLLIVEWLDHMEYLQEHYPYLFSLRVRTNPFDPSAVAEVTEDGGSQQSGHANEG